MWRFSGFTVYKLLSCTWSNFTLRRVLGNRWSRYCFSSHCTFQETVTTSKGVSKATGQSGVLPILGWLLDIKSHVLFTLGPCFRAPLPGKVDSNLSLLWILFTCTYLRCWSQGQSWNQSVAGISNPYHIDKEDDLVVNLTYSFCRFKNVKPPTGWFMFNAPSPGGKKREIFRLFLCLSC